MSQFCMMCSKADFTTEAGPNNTMQNIKMPSAHLTDTVHHSAVILSTKHLRPPYKDKQQCRQDSSLHLRAIHPHSGL